MKKIPTLFERVYENHRIVDIKPNVTPGYEWVLEGKGKASYLNASSDTFVADLSDEQISKLSSELEAAYERDGLKYGRATVVKKMEQLQKEVPSMRKYLTVSDLITPEGRANIKSWSEELNSLINCRYGTNTPKIIQKFNPYNSELAKYGIVPKAYKSLVTRVCNQRFQTPGRKQFQTSFYETILRDENMYQKCWRYIEGNPSKWLEEYTDDT